MKKDSETKEEKKDSETKEGENTSGKKQKVEFKIQGDDRNTQDEDPKITILEPQEIISLLLILDNTDEESIAKT